MDTSKITLGISSCLLGDTVRFDGGHKRDLYVVNLLANYFAFIAICPEVGAGLGVPRPPIRLMGAPNSPQVVEVKDKTNDHTAALHTYSHSAMGQLAEVSGYILKNKSPSCGWKNVKVYQDHGSPPKVGMGVFARILTDTYPLLPIEEEGRLNDYKLRENFIERVFMYHRWQQLIKEGLTSKRLIEFHSRHKLTLMAHSEKSYRHLGRLLANLKGPQPLNAIADEYIACLMKGMAFLATPKKHANVLMHCLGYFKKWLSPDDKAELLAAIDQYRLGLLPLIVPITLLKHHLRHFPNDYLLAQSYLDPYPQELMLRNHI